MRRLLAGWLTWFALSPAPLARGERMPSATIPGLSAPVSILTDRWGIPHIQARNLDDLYRAWGWCVARDRLWQLMWTRAQGEGTTHRWRGNAALQADGGAQLFRFAERAREIWARDAGDSGTRAAIEAHAAGINAYLAACRRGEQPWPPELARLRESPRDWRPEDTVLMLLGLGVTLDLDLPELREAEELKVRGASGFAARRRFESQWRYETVPGAPATASTRTAAATASTLPAHTLALARRAAAALPMHEPDGSTRASNVFAVGASRSASGRPLLANDPHLALTTPGPLYVVHVSVPGTCDAIGASVPGLPFVVSGRNADVAWGLTALGADVIDVYADTLSADGRRAKGPSGWTSVRTLPFALAFKAGPLRLPIPSFAQARRYTEHGPVIAWDPKHRLALAARWSAFEDERITLRRLIGLERSRDADEIAARVRSVVTPTINVVAADVRGEVVYQSIGLVPRRSWPAVPGPLPSDGRHEWQGFIPADAMPSWRVPRARYVVNANNAPARDSSAASWPRYDWAHDRALRIDQRLAGDPRVSLADLASVQSDIVSRAATRQTPALIACAESSSATWTPRVRAAIDTLKRWDYRASRRSTAPTLSRSWWSTFVERSGYAGTPGLALAVLEGRAPDQPPTTRGRVETPSVAALAALEAALDSLTLKLGPEPSGWTWGRAHRARFRHPLSSLDSRERWERATVAEDGDGSTPAVAGSSAPRSFDVTHGPGFRHVVDLAIPDSSLGMVAPFNRAAQDLRERWALRGYVPFLTSRARIEAHTIDRVELTPGR